jgi:hypothetical protein
MPARAIGLGTLAVDRVGAPRKGHTANRNPKSDRLVWKLISQRRYGKTAIMRPPNINDPLKVVAMCDKNVIGEPAAT